MTEQIAIILQNWQPSQLQPDIIRDEYTQLLSSYGLYSDPDAGINPRSPAKGRADYHLNAPWHQDAHEGIYPEIIVIWSNVLPTEVRGGSEPFTARDGDVILIYNRQAEHRAPFLASVSQTRWLCHCWITEG